MIKKFFSIIVIIICLLYPIIRRFLKLNLSKNVINNVIAAEFFIIEYTTILFILLTILTIYSIKKDKNKINDGNIFKITQVINNIKDNYYYKPLKFLSDMVRLYLEKNMNIDVTKYLVQIQSYFYYEILLPNDFKKFNKYFITYFLIKYVIKIIIAFIFLIDILYFEVIYYFYWSLPWLILPLILQYIKYIFFQDYNKIKLKLEENIQILDIRPSTTEDIIPLLSYTEYLEVAIHYILSKKPNPYKKIVLSYNYYQKKSVDELKTKKMDYDSVKEKLKPFMDWNTKIYIIDHLLSSIEKQYDLYVNLLVFTCYLIGWGYLWIFSLSILFPQYFCLQIQDTNPFI